MSMSSVDEFMNKLFKFNIIDINKRHNIELMNFLKDLYESRYGQITETEWNEAINRVVSRSWSYIAQESNLFKHKHYHISSTNNINWNLDMDLIVALVLEDGSLTCSTINYFEEPPEVDIYVINPGDNTFEESEDIHYETIDTTNTTDDTDNIIDTFNIDIRIQHKDFERNIYFFKYTVKRITDKQFEFKLNGFHSLNLLN